MNHTVKQAAQLIQALGASTLLKKGSPEMLKERVKKMKIYRHAKVETIIKKNDFGYTMFFIMLGEVKIHDNEHLLARLISGEFFGEMSILDREPGSMSVTAEAPSVTGSI